MGVVEFANSPWGESVPIHIAFGLIWVAFIGGLAFFIVHAIWLRYFAGADEYEPSGAADRALPAAKLPTEIPRHSLAARLFHWIMAASMLTLLFTAFLPKVGVQFPWVTYHWIAGLVLTASILFHVVHTTFFLDPWSIWPDKTDWEDAKRRWARSTGKQAPPPHRFAKYPLENKAYHFAILLSGLSVMLTGLFMLKKVHTPFFTRNPYIFGDMTWGLMYVLHGLAGVGLIGLIMVHIYFAVRPEKLVITKSMITGGLNREHYLEHHDPARWAPDAMANVKRAGGTL